MLRFIDMLERVRDSGEIVMLEHNLYTIKCGNSLGKAQIPSHHRRKQSSLLIYEVKNEKYSRTSHESESK